MMKNFCFLIIGLTLIISGCKKDAELVVIPNNQAPPDYTIESIVKENYVNKVYISVLGRKPEASELSSGLSYINQHNLSIADRNLFLDEVFEKPAYNQRLYEIASIKLLTSFDTATITETIAIFQFLLTDSSYAAVFDQLNFEIARMQQLKAIPADLNNGTLNTIGMHKRLINNYFYDQINMGTENFVVSSFQHFMDRYPTTSELQQGVNMVNGLSAVLFLIQGDTKDQYMDVLLNTDNYFESQVRELYLRYLFRQPTSVEMTTHASAYKADLDYKKLQKTILSLDEYAGIN
ncbi:MAG: hypothetical protein V4608_14600 [Bacteroidota bacterium]